MIPQLESQKLLSSVKRNFAECCACPGCLALPLQGSHFCISCCRVSAPCRARTDTVHQRTVREYIASHPEAAGKLHQNVKNTGSTSANLAIVKGNPQLQPSLWKAFENSCKAKKLQPPSGTDQWFMCGDKFSQALRMTGYVIQDIHGDSFPDAWQVVFIPDFGTSLCIQQGCNRPAHVRSLASAQHFRPFAPTTFKQNGETIRKGYAIAALHPAIRIVCTAPDQCHLCVRHANARVNSALTATMYYQLMVKRQMQPCLPAEIMQLIIDHVLRSA